MPRSFRDRVQTLYMAVTGSLHPQGAFAWFARLKGLGIPPRTIRRYANGERDPGNSRTGQRVLAQLAMHEENEPQAALKKAWKTLREYRDQRPETTADWENWGR